MKSPPNKIFLHWHTEDCSEDCAEEVTWCEDQIDETDVEYVRKEAVQEVLKMYFVEDTYEYILLKTLIDNINTYNKEPLN